MGPSKHLKRILALRQKYEKTKMSKMPNKSRVNRKMSDKGDFLRGRPSLIKHKSKEPVVASNTLVEHMDNVLE